VIPIEHLNDDYCDCADGSDEPGTNACLGGSFTCQNFGFVTTGIPSSRVNDGICDCCDGSDEYRSNRVCENTCNEMASKAREEEERTKRVVEAGIAVKKELIQKGIEMRKYLRVKLDELESKKINAENEKSKLEEAKNILESKAKELTDIQDAKFEEERQKRLAIEKEIKSNELFAKLDENSDGNLRPEELIKHKDLDTLFNNDGEFTLEEAELLLDKLEVVDPRTFYDNYFDKISSYVQNLERQHEELERNDEEEAPSENENEEQEEMNQDEGQEEMNQDEGQEEEQEHASTPVPPTHQVNDKPEYDEKTKELLAEAEKARNEYATAEQELRNVLSEISEIQRKLDYDVGSNEEFASMIDQCFEYDDREYIYRLCPFDKTIQKSKNGHGETSIGSWNSWETDPAGRKYKIMSYTNGLTCWNGPARSTKVYLACGSENKITSVGEPNRCEYEMHLETPCACDMSASTPNLGHDEF
jgi:protein kinase C substrate 80K-H